ncbi:MAG: hypothetical protein CVU62_13925 [Deltaproteobacteria bacterium HGW-Deltaproteobacteria-2]|jgi:hypothetical protein|nr:MAG: hypothetical protein CVU62_13925 [Deltaproteobacteria bacterium HGW-Deltaproteobacteria-2]
MDTFFKIINVVMAIVVLYIGYKQTQKYRNEDKKEKLQSALDESHRNELKKSIKGISDTLKKTTEDIFFMFDNHGHEILCNNESCTKPRTGKIFIAPPQQRRESDRL